VSLSFGDKNLLFTYWLLYHLQKFVIEGNGGKGLTISCNKSEMAFQFSAAATSSSSQHVSDSRQVVVQSWIFNEISQFGSTCMFFGKLVAANTYAF
jgi:hypothetical protein